MTTLTKVCVRCKAEKPVTEFYTRSGCKTPTETGHYNSECKDCLKDRSKHLERLPPTMPRAETEIYAIEAFHKQGIPALPGKAVKAAHVDIMCFGIVGVEAKYSKLVNNHGTRQFVFNTSPKQQQRGFLGQVVMLICDYGDRKTYHLFNADDPVFYIERQKYDFQKHEPISTYRVKSGLTFVPGRVVPLKHGDNRVVMVQSMMDEAENRWELIFQWLEYLRDQLRNSA